MTYRKVSTVLRSCLLGLLCASFAGCGVSQFTANTTASYESPDGRKIFFSTNQNQQGFHAKATVDPATGRITSVDVKVNQSGTPVEAINAAAEAQRDNAAMARELTATVAPIVAGAIKGGALGGGPGAGIGAVTGALQGKANAGAGAAPIP